MQSGNNALPMKILADLQSGLAEFEGWQATFNIRDRAGRIMQLLTQLRALTPNEDPQGVLNVAQKWELTTIRNAPSKEVYLMQMNQKMADITAKRQQQAGQMPFGGLGNMGMANGSNMGMMNGGNMGMMNGGNMGMMNGSNMGMPAGHMNGFPTHLQRPMQPSPLQMRQQSHQRSQQQPSTTMDPSALQIPTQQPQAQHGEQNMRQTALPQAPNMAQGRQDPPGNPMQQPGNEVLLIAKRYYDSMTEENKLGLRQRMLSTMTDVQRAGLKGTDPVMRLCIQNASKQLRQRMAGGLAPQQQQQQPGTQHGGNMNMQAGNNAPPRPNSRNTGQLIDFSGILGQQANALKLQESGEQVVPASNHNNANNMMAVGNQMNPQHNINPQMLGNNNGHGTLGGSTNGNQLSFFLMQQEAQQRERAQKQIMASRNQLQGQRGGLHTPNAFNGGLAGQINSPAMPMLTQPMVPPGQNAPNTPQTNRRQQVPATPMNGANQIAQHHQNMVNQNSQQMNQAVMADPNGLMRSMMPQIPEQYRAQLAQMPPDQAIHVMARMIQQMRAGGQSGPAGQAGLLNMNPGPLQQGNQRPQNTLQPPASNPNPGYSSQSQPNLTQMDSAAQKQQVQMRLRIQAFDSRPFPKPILGQLGIAVPPQVQTWGQLKHHVSTNSPAGTLQKVQEQQGVWFKSRPEEAGLALKALMEQRQRMQQGGQSVPQAQAIQQNRPQQQDIGGKSSMPMSMAQAQMVPPAPMMQPTNQTVPLNMSQVSQHMPGIPQPSAQEIDMFRTKFPHAAHLGDDQIRGILMKQKFERLKAMQQNKMMQQRPPNQAGSVPPGNLASSAQIQQSTPQPVPPQSAVGQAGQQGQQKQSASSDVIEISSQAAQQIPPPAQKTQSHLSQAQAAPQMQQQLPQLSPEQLRQMSDTQRTAYFQGMQRQAHARQMEGLRRTQGETANPIPAAHGANPSGMPPEATLEKLHSLRQEVVKANPRGPRVEIDAAGMEKAKAMLAKLWKPLATLSNTFPRAYSYGFSDRYLKDIMRAWHLVTMNAKDETGTLNDYLSITLEQLQELERVVAGYLVDLKKNRDLLCAKNRQQSGPAPTPAPAVYGVPGGPSMPASAGKTQQLSGMAPGIAQQGQTRKPSAASKAPPAPTDNKTFDWAAPSPHGVPKYEAGRPELTSDKLRFPPPKKRKTDQTNSQASTPAAQAGTPATSGASPALASNKTQSPEQSRKKQAPPKAETERQVEQKKFRCKDPLCEVTLPGFETEEQLKQHEQTLHQPIENPLQFLLDEASKALGVDADGTMPAKTSAIPSRAPVVVSRKPLMATARDLKEAELTKHEKELLSRGITSASLKQKIAKKQAEFDAANKLANQKELSLRAAMAQKLDITLPSVPIAESTEVNMIPEPGPIWPMDDLPDEHGWRPLTVERMMQLEEEGWVETDPWHGVWELRPGHAESESSPELTPGGSASSKSSDVSQTDAMKFTIAMENFDADLWGDGGGRGVPEAFISLYHQIKESTKDSEDPIMGNTGDEKDMARDSKKRKADEWAIPIKDFMDHFWSQR